MSSTDYVKLTLDAIYSVRKRAKAAMESGEMATYSKLMGDLYALECCLVGESQKLVDDLEYTQKSA